MWYIVYHCPHPFGELIFGHYIQCNKKPQLCERQLRSYRFFFKFHIYHITLPLKSSDFNGFNHISSQNGWYTFQIWYDNFLFRKFIRFPYFSYFQNFRCLLVFISYFLEDLWCTFQIWFDDFFLLLWQMHAKYSSILANNVWFLSGWQKFVTK